MCTYCDGASPFPAKFRCDAEVAPRSRRTILKSSIGFALGAFVPALAARSAIAQASRIPSDLSRLAASSRILIANAVVISMDEQIGDFANADILIEDGKIREIRPDIAVDPQATAVVDGRDRIVIPGFVDTHHHCYQGILRNILPDGLVRPEYIRDINDRLTAVFAPDDVYAGTLITALGMIDNGTTCVVDTSQVSHTPEHNDAGIRAFQESGLRAVYGYSWGAGPRTQYPQDIGRLQRAYSPQRINC
jgi:5-methylthioadenosine/S-adenosylhomocysteine deaminase